MRTNQHGSSAMGNINDFRIAVWSGYVNFDVWMPRTSTLNLLEAWNSLEASASSKITCLTLIACWYIYHGHWFGFGNSSTGNLVSPAVCSYLFYLYLACKRSSSTGLKFCNCAIIIGFVIALLWLFRVYAFASHRSASKELFVGLLRSVWTVPRCWLPRRPIANPETRLVQLQTWKALWHTAALAKKPDHSDKHLDKRYTYDIHVYKHI